MKGKGKGRGSQTATHSQHETEREIDKLSGNSHMNVQMGRVTMHKLVVRQQKGVTLRDVSDSSQFSVQLE